MPEHLWFQGDYWVSIFVVGVQGRQQGTILIVLSHS